MKKIYSIEIVGMHCSGCKNLIALSLDEAGMTDILVDEKHGSAQFASGLDTISVQKSLDSIFAELPDYAYTNLQEKE